MCVPDCPASTPFWSGVECWDCARAWAGTIKFYSPSAAQCVESCPEDAPVREGTTICMSCEEAHPNEDRTFWDQAAGKCVKECP